MSEKEKKSCDAGACEADCETCEKARHNNLNVDKLSVDELKALYKNQCEMISALVNENEELMKQQAELNKKIEKGNGYLDQLARMKGDFENFKRRTKNSDDFSKREGKAEVIEKILPILDTFARAGESLKGKVELESFLMVAKQMEQILHKIGLEEIAVLGEDFDPNLSNAISKTEAGEEKKGKVIEVLSKGYKFNDKIVRYSQVIVGC